MLPVETLSAIQSFVTAVEHRVFSAMLQRVPDFMIAHDCGPFFPIEDAHDFALRWRALHHWRMVADNNARRLTQLVAGNYEFWVYKTGIGLSCAEHAAWDGFAAPSGHPIWETHCPANSWTCSCYLRGADGLNGIMRAKGDPKKGLPEGWETPLATTGLPLGIELGFGTSMFPNLAACLDALRDGHHLRLS